MDASATIAQARSAWAYSLDLRGLATLGSFREFAKATVSGESTFSEKNASSSWSVKANARLTPRGIALSTCSLSRARKEATNSSGRAMPDDGDFSSKNSPQESWKADGRPPCAKTGAPEESSAYRSPWYFNSR